MVIWVRQEEKLFKGKEKNTGIGCLGRVWSLCHYRSLKAGWRKIWLVTSVKVFNSIAGFMIFLVENLGTENGSDLLTAQWIT